MKENRPFYINLNKAKESFKIHSHNVELLQGEVYQLSWYQWRRRKLLRTKLFSEMLGRIEALKDVQYYEDLKKSWDDIARNI